MTAEKTPPTTTKTPTGRPPAPPRTEDGKLIANALKALGCSKGELAKAIEAETGRSFFQVRLTQANREGSTPLADDQRKAIAAILARASKKKTTKK